MGLFTENRKTILSVDFNRDNTCNSICDYCYVENTERQYTAYKTKILTNYTRSLQDPKTFALTLNKEYAKARASRAKAYTNLKKLPVRIYGSGDYIPIHFEFLQHLNFDFYIISKNLTLTTMATQLSTLLKLPLLTSIVLSFDTKNLQNYNSLLPYFKHSKVTTSFTGTADEYAKATSTKKVFGIFFNTDRTKKGLTKSALHKASCPCDSGKIPSVGACTKCSKCWKPKKEFKIRLQKI